MVKSNSTTFDSILQKLKDNKVIAIVLVIIFILFMFSQVINQFTDALNKIFVFFDSNSSQQADSANVKTEKKEKRSNVKIDEDSTLMELKKKYGALDVKKTLLGKEVNLLANFAKPVKFTVNKEKDNYALLMISDIGKEKAQWPSFHNEFTHHFSIRSRPVDLQYDLQIRVKEDTVFLNLILNEEYTRNAFKRH
jgi:hypothetical protein